MTYYDYATAIAHKLPPWDTNSSAYLMRPEVKEARSRLTVRRTGVRSGLASFLQRCGVRLKPNVPTRSRPAVSE